MLFIFLQPRNAFCAIEVTVPGTVNAPFLPDGQRTSFFPFFVYNTPSTAFKYLLLPLTEKELTLTVSKASAAMAETFSLIYTLLPPEYDVNIP